MSGTLCLSAMAWLGVLMTGQKVEASVNEEQFIRLMTSSYEKVKDITFMFEGDLRFVGPVELLQGMPDGMSEQFQGEYGFRSDGKTRLDVYSRPLGKEKVSVRTTSLLTGKHVETLHVFPDEKLSSARTRKSAGYKGALSGLNGPERFMYRWWIGSVEHQVYSRFRCVDWEMVGDARCLHVEFAEVLTEGTTETRTQHFWHDMAKDGQVVRYELRAGRDVVSRVEDVCVERVPDEDGNEVWIPMSAKRNSYIWGDKVGGTPMFTETYKILVRSVHVNQGLQDSYFVLRRKAEKYDGNEDARIVKGLKRERQRLLRSDPNGASARIDEALADAKKQGELLAVSAAPEAAGSWEAVVRHGLIWGGVGCVLLAALRWRARSGVRP